MFDICEKLMSERKHRSLIGDEEVISLLHAKVHVFSDCLGRQVDVVQKFTIQSFGHN